jgi:hypothetical protein
MVTGAYQIDRNGTVFMEVAVTIQRLYVYDSSVGL